MPSWMGLKVLVIVLSSLVSQAWTQDAASTICGDVFSTQPDNLTAVDAYNCLTTTPFNRTLASELVGYWKDTIQFQSTLAYLKDPPPGYQQPSVDLLGGFDLIQDQIDNGVFSNHYSFEATVHSLLQRSHAFHISISGGLFSVFAFTPSFYFTSISLDGMSLPQVYDGEAVYLWQNGTYSSPPSPLKLINGQVAEKWLASYASRNSYGALEPHGDWNQIMWSWAAAIQGYLDPFATPFYPGESLSIEYENGTQKDIPWMAIYNGDSAIPIIETGQDLYDWFVLGEDTPSNIAKYGSPVTTTSSIPQATSDGSDDVPTLTSVATSTATPVSYNYSGWGGAYPDEPDVVQPNLGEGGWVTGYFLQDSKIGVLSIPSFAVDETPEAVKNFSLSVKEFLTKSKEAGVTKVLIDLQQNYGGEQLLAAKTFGQFFPDKSPFAGMRTRSFELANDIGQTMTSYFQEHYGTLNESLVDHLVNDPWAVTNEINADTQQNFSSWQQYYGPHPDKNDYFSTVFQYNFTNPVYEMVAGGVDIDDPSTRMNASSYDAQDITILTDSICASTCDLFVEMMHHEMGVRTVVVGGLPQEGPMQARGAERGAMSLNNMVVDGNILYGSTLNGSVTAHLFDRSYEASLITTMTFNFADQIRSKEYFPLQFAYEAADCRIFYTPETFFNYTKLWEYAASAIFFNASTCVAHSAEHNNTMQTDMYGPSAPQKVAWAATNPANVKVVQNETLDMQVDDTDLSPGYNLDMTIVNGWWSNWYCVGSNCFWQPVVKATSYEISKQMLTTEYNVPDSFTGKRTTGKSASNGYSPRGASGVTPPGRSSGGGRKRSLKPRKLLHRRIAA